MLPGVRILDLGQVIASPNGGTIEAGRTERSIVHRVIFLPFQLTLNLFDPQ